MTSGASSIRLSRFVGLLRTSSFWAVTLSSLLIYSLGEQKFISEKLSLLERSALGLAGLLLIFVVFKQRTKTYYLPPTIVALTLLAGLSTTQLPEYTVLKDFAAYSLIVVFAVVFASTFGVEISIRAIAIAGMLLVTTNLTLAITRGNYVAIERLGTTYFHGTSYGSNTLAASVIATIPAVIAVRWSSRRATLTWRVISLSLAAYLLLLTSARTSWISFVVILVSWGILALPGRANRKIFTTVGILTFSAILVFLNLSTFTQVFGKSDSLSGRIPLWQAYLDEIMKQPFTGFGWSIQTNTNMPLGQAIWQKMNYPLANAHDDFLNWWAQTGVLGALLFLLSVAGLIVGGIASRDSKNRMLFFTLTGLAVGVSGITELTTTYADGWAVFTLALTCVAIALATQPRNFLKALFSAQLPTKPRKTNIE